MATTSKKTSVSPMIDRSLIGDELALTIGHYVNEQEDSRNFVNGMMGSKVPKHRNAWMDARGSDADALWAEYFSFEHKIAALREAQTKYNSLVNVEVGGEKMTLAVAIDRQRLLRHHKGIMQQHLSCWSRAFGPASKMKLGDVANAIDDVDAKIEAYRVVIHEANRTQSVHLQIPLPESIFNEVDLTDAGKVNKRNSSGK